MAAKSSEWRPGPTVCRCCLTEGCYKDISTEYFWMGKREVYAEMLKDTLDVSIAYSKAGGPNSNSRLICEPCISRLRDATEFKRQVVECERMFMQHLDPGSSSLNVDLDSEPLDKIKIEGVKLEKGNSDDDFDDRQDFGLDDDDDDDDDDLDNQPLTKLASKVPKKESVDLLDLLDNSKAAEKRKASTKAKAPPPKKAKAKVEPPKPKPTSSKPKPEKKKKGDRSNIKVKSTRTKTITIKKTRQIGEEELLQNSVIKNETLSTGESLSGSVETNQDGLVTVKVESLDSAVNVNVAPVRSIIMKKKTQRSMVIPSNRMIMKPLPANTTRKSAISLLRDTTLCPFKFSQGSFQCFYCTNLFLNIKQVEEHVKQHDGLTKDDIYKVLVRKSTSELIKLNVREYGCKICGDVSVDLSSLKQHLTDKHSLRFNPESDGVALYKIDEDKFECALCSKTFVTYRQLNMHAREHYMKIFCDQCGAGFITTTAMTIHLKSHESGSYPCPECGKVFKNKIGRDEHVKVVHARTKKSVCNICRERFFEYIDKLKHMKDVHDAKIPTYKCNYCPKVYLKSSDLKKHENLSHLKSTCYRCDICSYSHHNKASLTRHMIVHKGEKIHKCQACGKAYSRKSTLRQHLRIHADDRRFKCNYCDKAFVQKCSLKGHMKTHHKDVNFE